MIDSSSSYKNVPILEKEFPFGRFEPRRRQDKMFSFKSRTGDVFGMFEKKEQERSSNSIASN
ncbi:hypothetical protein BLOT_003537 [Blomia tropicalis]|nr:hypothetical protein BLOT_003537 [Blomia tropicalis]